MALIAFPDVSLESISCDLVWPGQDIVSSIYTGSVQATSRGIGRWQGTFAFPQLGRADGAADIGKIDAFFSATEGALHIFDLPFEAIAAAQQTRFADGTDLRLMSMERTGGSFIANLNQATGLEVGDRVTIDNRLFVLITTHTGGRCTLAPHRDLVIPTGGLPINWTAPTLRARLTESSPVSINRNRDWHGPTAAAFQDVL